MSEAFDLRWDRAFELYEDGKLVEAIAEWQEAGRLDPEDGYVLHNIGCALWDLGQPEAAIAQWREAILLEPDYGPPHRRLALALSDSGYSPEALVAVRAAVRLCPDDAGLHVWLGYHLAAKTGGVYESGYRAAYEEARAAFQRAVDLDPLNSYALHFLATLQWWLGEKQKAIQTLKDAVVVDPSDAEAHIALFEYQGRTRRFRDMVQTITAINGLPDSEARERHFETVTLWINRLWLRVGIISLIGIGVAAILLWRRWQERE